MKRSTQLLPSPRQSGFTLIELLVVIAIIGSLAAIVIPTVGAVRTSANNAKTKTQFSQWASAMELFKQEYGFYPDIGQGTTGGGKLDTTKFLANLTGRDYRGTQFSGAALERNTKRISFYLVSNGELAAGADGAGTNEIIDAFGNSDIMVMTDRNRDGIISGAELNRTNLQVGNTVEGRRSNTVQPNAADFPTSGLRVGVAFYSVGKGDTARDYVLSWK